MTDNEKGGVRSMVAAFAGSRPKRPLRECVYCGSFAYGKACREHRDLIQLDPSMGGTQS